MADVQTRLLEERRRLLPWEDESAARARVGALDRHSPAELDALLARIQRTQRFEDAVGWLDSASIGLPRVVYESALLIYRDSVMLSWAECVTLTRLLSYPRPRFTEWNLTALAGYPGEK